MSEEEFEDQLMLSLINDTIRVYELMGIEVTEEKVAIAVKSRRKNYRNYIIYWE